MFPDNLAISVIDVLNFHQKREKMSVSARNFSAITLRLKTAGKYLCKGKTVSFEPGSICIIPEGVDYERNNQEEDILVIHFQFLNFAMEQIQIFKINDTEKYKKLFERALMLKYENSTGANYRITAVTYEIFSELIKDVGFAANLKDNRIIEAAEYIRQNFWNPELTIDSLSNQASVSPAYFRREFNRLYGASPKAYLDTIRIQYAKSLLETGYFSQKEIAARCGFLDVAYFRTAFKNKVGKSIREYLADDNKNSY